MKVVFCSPYSVVKSAGLPRGVTWPVVPVSGDIDSFSEIMPSGLDDLNPAGFPLTLFLAPVYVPLDLLTGWIKGVASLNPATAFLQAGRGFLSGVHQTSALAFLCGAGLVALMGVYALRGLRKAERGT